MPRGKHDGHAKGPDHPRWNRERMISSQGYVVIRVGEGHPMAFGKGYAYEHDLVAATALGRPLRPDEIVHHLSEDRTDNRWENLRVETRAEHAGHHAGGDRDPVTGRFVKRGGPRPYSGGNILDGRTWEEFPTISAARGELVGAAR